MTQINVSRFDLNACECKANFDVNYLPEKLEKAFQAQIKRYRKRLDRIQGDLHIKGRFVRIDAGNSGLRFLLPMLGKPSIACQVTATLDDRSICDELFLGTLPQFWFIPTSYFLGNEISLCLARNVILAILDRMEKNRG